MATEISAEIIAEMRIDASNWVPLEQFTPPCGMAVLAFYTNSLGKGRIVKSQWIKAKTVEADIDNDDEVVYEWSDDDETAYLREGWYEMIDNWGDFSFVFIHEGTPTHWMPLPRYPAYATSEGE